MSPIHFTLVTNKSVLFGGPDICMSYLHDFIYYSKRSENYASDAIYGDD